MEVIVHLIRLHPGIEPERFESWVCEVDYATCPELPSVCSFSVQRCAGADLSQYFEVIAVRSLAEFERDMATAAFAELERAFDTMASVVGTLSGTRLGAGYFSSR